MIRESRAWLEQSIKIEPDRGEALTELARVRDVPDSLPVLPAGSESRRRKERCVGAAGESRPVTQRRLGRFIELDRQRVRRPLWMVRRGLESHTGITAARAGDFHRGHDGRGFWAFRFRQRWMAGHLLCEWVVRFPIDVQVPPRPDRSRTGTRVTARFET